MLVNARRRLDKERLLLLYLSIGTCRGLFDDQLFTRYEIFHDLTITAGPLDNQTVRLYAFAEAEMRDRLIAREESGSTSMAGRWAFQPATCSSE